MSQFESGAFLKQYQILEQIGRGGMATVYKAHQTNLDRLVAIKVLPHFFAEEPAFLERFRLEAQAVARLRHTNILTVFDYGEENGVTFLVTEFLPGGTLADRLGLPLPLAFVTTIANQIGSALDYAHSREIVHRDVKPSNILLTDDGTAVLADFGLARILSGNRRLTASGMFLGTPEYMSPEQSLQGTIDGRSDIYSLGVVLYEMLIGATPYTADTPTAMIMAHIHQPLPLPSSRNPAISREVEAVLVKTLAKDPADRYETAGLLAQALAAAAGLPIDSAGPLPTFPPTRITSFTPLPEIDSPSEPAASQQRETLPSPGSEPTIVSTPLPTLRGPGEHPGATTLVTEKAIGNGEALTQPGLMATVPPSQAQPTLGNQDLGRNRKKLIILGTGLGLVLLLTIAFLVLFSRSAPSPGGVVSLEADPQSGPPGTTFTVEGSGFKNGENVTLEFVTPAGKTVAGRQYQIIDGNLNETIDLTNSGRDVAAGLYTIKASGDQGSRASTSFRVSPGEWATVRPLIARVGTSFQIFGGGFTSDEDIKLTITGPGLATTTTLSVNADKQGRFETGWQPKGANLGGEYRITAEGDKGHRVTSRVLLTNR